MAKAYYTIIEQGFKVFALSLIISCLILVIGLIIGAILDADSVDRSQHPVLCKTSDYMLKLGMWNAVICTLIMLIGFLIHAIISIAMSIFV